MTASYVVRAFALLPFTICPGALGATSGSAPDGPPPRLSVDSSTGTFADPVVVRVTGAPPGAAVRLRLSFADGAGTRWTAEGRYFASPTGEVDTRLHASVGGTYTGAGAAQLLCSVLPVASERLESHIAALPDASPPRVSPVVSDERPIRLSVEAEIAGGPALLAEATRGYGGPGVDALAVDTEQVKGTFYRPRTASGLPVVVIGGSGGGVPWQQAALLAAEGHPALAVAYFAFPGLSADLRDVPIERFVAATDWLRGQTGQQSIGVIGTSRGSEAAALLATYFPAGISRVVLLVPSHVVNGGFGPGVSGPAAAWTLRGRPVPFVTSTRQQQTRMARALAQDGARAPGFVGTPTFLESWVAPGAEDRYGIPLERFPGRVLAIGGAADTMWPSAVGAARIVERVRRTGAPDRARAVILEGAGHSISVPPFANAMSHFSVHPVAKQFVSVGGVPRYNCEGKFEAWKALREFLA